MYVGDKSKDNQVWNIEKLITGRNENLNLFSILVERVGSLFKTARRSNFLNSNDFGTLVVQSIPPDLDREGIL